jgi:structural maintenance of chromosome 1
MDAISFVLGVRSAKLRSSQLKDLIYRAGRNDDVDAEDPETEPSQSQQEEEARDAWVLAVYIDKKGTEWKYKRSINLSGSSEYRVNGKLETASAYNDSLKKHGILVKAKNFLVFQGDVEAVASQNPKDLTRLIEQISGSLEFKDEYDQAKVRQDKAAEVSTHNYVKRRGMNAELKQFKEQKSEAEKFASLREDRVGVLLTFWSISHC